MGKKRHGKSCFRGDEWFHAKVAGRTYNAIPQMHRQFAMSHTNASDEQLLEYVRQQAALMGCTPNACEIIGGAFIAARFGSWQSAVSAAGLARPGDAAPLEKRYIYKQEFKRQARLLRQEREAKKEARQSDNRQTTAGDGEKPREAGAAEGEKGTGIS